MDAKQQNQIVLSAPFILPATRAKLAKLEPTPQRLEVLSRFCPLLDTKDTIIQEARDASEHAQLNSDKPYSRPETRVPDFDILCAALVTRASKLVPMPFESASDYKSPGLLLSAALVTRASKLIPEPFESVVNHKSDGRTATTLRFTNQFSPEPLIIIVENMGQQMISTIVGVRLFPPDKPLSEFDPGIQSWLVPPKKREAHLPTLRTVPTRRKWSGIPQKLSTFLITTGHAPALIRTRS